MSKTVSGTERETANESARQTKADLRRELEATEDLVIRLGKILSETALALKGPPPPLTTHSTHDLAEVARATVSQLDAMRKTAQEWWDLSEMRREDDLRLRASVRAEHAALRAQLDEALADRERLLRHVEGSNANASASQSTEERAREVWAARLSKLWWAHTAAATKATSYGAAALGAGEEKPRPRLRFHDCCELPLAPWSLVATV